MFAQRLLSLLLELLVGSRVLVAPGADVALIHLLQDLLRPQDTKLLVLSLYGASVWNELRTNGSHCENCTELVELLRRRGQIDRRLFEYLGRIAPRRLAEIAKVSVAYGL